MNQKQLRVLMVEDDQRLGDLTSIYLRHRGLDVQCLSTAEAALSYLEHNSPDVILLDIQLPGMGGHQACQIMRQLCGAPIIMVSALDDEADLVMGLEGGADDYITKPFSSRELLARIRAQVRRYHRGEDHERIELGPLVIDGMTREVYLNERLVGLTSQEFDLLTALAKRAGRVLTREQIIGLIHLRDDEVFERAVDVQISRLRQKLEENPKSPTWIKTVRGVGYVLSHRIHDE